MDLLMGQVSRQVGAIGALLDVPATLMMETAEKEEGPLLQGEYWMG